MKSAFAAAMSLAALTGCAAVTLPERQQAVVQDGLGGPEVLSLRDVPVLAPGPDQVLIRVHAAGVNPVDWKMRQGHRPGQDTPPASAPEPPPPRIPGFDVAGEIVAVGSNVEPSRIGEAVFTMLGMIKVAGLNGGYSEYVIAGADNAVTKPSTLTFVQAAGIGVAGMTAARLLHELTIKPGTRVFINGIAGGVGSAAAQIARAGGATVVGTASARHHEYLKSLGVDQVVDYTQVDFTEVVAPVDIYVEAVSAKLATRGLSIIKAGGHLRSPVGTPTESDCQRAQVDCHMLAIPDRKTEGDRLREVAALAEQGDFTVHIDRTFPLAEAAAAQEYNRAGHTQGKVVLTVMPTAGNPAP